MAKPAKKPQRTAVTTMPDVTPKGIEGPSMPTNNPSPIFQLPPLRPQPDGYGC